MNAKPAIISILALVVGIYAGVFHSFILIAASFFLWGWAAVQPTR